MRPEDASETLTEDVMNDLASLALDGLGLRPVGQSVSLDASLAALDKLEELGDPHGYRERLKQALRDKELGKIPEIMDEVRIYLASLTAA